MIVSLEMNGGRGNFVCFLRSKLFHYDGSAMDMSYSLTLRCKMHIRLGILPIYGMLTPDQPVYGP